MVLAQGQAAHADADALDRHGLGQGSMTRTKTPKLRGGVPVPEVLLPSIAKAKARTLKRRHGPPISLQRNPDGSTQWTWPFEWTEDEDSSWRWLVIDAFGTRCEGVAGAFLKHLVDLCGAEYDEAASEWVPDESELIALLHIVSAHKPRDEAQASLAAQMAATHIITMKVAKRVTDYIHDTRMIGAYANLARASALQFEAMATLKGKRRSTRQQITVKHEKHVHQHQHVHVTGGGSGSDDQAQAAIATANRAALPCANTPGQDVRLAIGEGQEGLPNARGRQRVRRAEG